MNAKFTATLFLVLILNSALPLVAKDFTDLEALVKECTESPAAFRAKGVPFLTEDIRGKFSKGVTVYYAIPLSVSADRTKVLITVAAENNSENLIFKGHDKHAYPVGNIEIPLDSAIPVSSVEFHQSVPDIKWNSNIAGEWRSQAEPPSFNQFRLQSGLIDRLNNTSVRQLISEKAIEKGLKAKEIVSADLDRSQPAFRALPPPGQYSYESAFVTADQVALRSTVTGESTHYGQSHLQVNKYTTDQNGKPVVYGSVVNVHFNVHWRSFADPLLTFKGELNHPETVFMRTDSSTPLENFPRYAVDFKLIPADGSFRKAAAEPGSSPNVLTLLNDLAKRTKMPFQNQIDQHSFSNLNMRSQIEFSGEYYIVEETSKTPSYWSASVSIYSPTLGFIAKASMYMNGEGRIGYSMNQLYEHQ